MLRRAIHAPSRAISSTIRVSAQRPLFRSQFQAATPSLLRGAPSQVTRWYSETKPEEKKEGEGEAALAEGEAKPAGAEDPQAALKKELEAKTKEVIDLKDKYLRSVADFRNLQDRTQREIKAARDFAIQRFAKDLVDSVDNLDRALAMVPEEKLNAEEKTEHLQDLVSLYDGIKMTETVLLNTLKNHGLERFDPDGQPFNPNEHEATFMNAMPDKEHNTVFATQQKGFKLHGRVIRPAKVGVVKNK